MPNKTKKIIPTNLATIREKLKYTQEDLAKILGVSKKMICYYEQECSNLPLEKAIYLSKRYNFSLDWIYKNPQNSQNTLKFKNYSDEECTKFLVDIRDFLICSDDKIKFCIKNAYWEYIKKLNAIKHSDKTQRIQSNEIAELNGNYKITDDTDIFWEFSIDINEFISMIHYQDGSCPIYTDDDSKNVSPPNDEQIEEIKEYLKSFVSSTN